MNRSHGRRDTRAKDRAETLRRKTVRRVKYATV